jgi:ethanolamine-phosphate phospho-lyase
MEAADSNCKNNSRERPPPDDGEEDGPPTKIQKQSPNDDCSTEIIESGLDKQLSYFESSHKMVRTEGQYLYDEGNNQYLDMAANIHYIGYCHSKVNEAATKQMSLLNTNSRFLNDKMALLGQQLAKVFPDDLSCCFFANSGSEANDLALQIANFITGNEDVIAIKGSYHGHLKPLRDINSHSHYNIKDQVRPDHVHLVSLPDMHRGNYRDPATAGSLYAEEVKGVIEDCNKRGKHISSFISESILSTSGMITLPQGYLKTIYELVRQDGGLCIADEINIGLGRVGKHLWAFQLHGVVPDIVTLGKGFGNGHPVAAVITTKEIANKFSASGIEYFNSFGGNPVSMATALAVIESVVEDDMQLKALSLGTYLMDKLKGLEKEFDRIGAVRGEGLLQALDMVCGQGSNEPDPSLAHQVKKRFVSLSMCVYMRVSV